MSVWLMVDTTELFCFLLCSLQWCWPTFVHSRPVFRGLHLWSDSLLLMIWNKSGRPETNTGYVYFSKLQRILHVYLHLPGTGGYFFIILIPLQKHLEMRATTAAWLPFKNTEVLPVLFLELLAWKHRPTNPERNPPGTKANTRFPPGTYKLTCGRPPGNTNQRVRMESI